MSTATGGSSLLSMWQAFHIQPSNNATMLAASAAGKCSMTIDGYCLPQSSSCEATMMAGANGSNNCSQKATLFAATNVPYTTEGIAAKPLAQLRALPGL